MKTTLIYIVSSFLFLSSCSQKTVTVDTKESRKKEVSAPKPSNVKVPTTFLDSKMVKKIHSRQARRKNALDSLKAKGVIGEASTGFIKVRTTKGLSPKTVNRMKKLVQVENNDRKLVYKKIQKMENYNKIEMRVLLDQMFQKYLELDLPGTYYYSQGQWQTKK